MGPEILFGTADDRALQRTVRIARGRQHHTDHRIRTEGRHRRPGQIAPRAGQQQGHHVPVQPHHQHLAFRIAETGVELDHLGPVRRGHQPGIEHPPIGHALGRHGRHHRLDDQPVRRLDQFRRENRRRRIAAHPAGVRSQIAVVGALVVLGPAQQHGALAVADGEQRALLAVHELLDHHPRPGRAEPAAQHPLDLALGLAAGRADGHALARRQPVGLDHIGGLEHAQRLPRLMQPLIDAEARRGDVVPLHEGLGKGLGCLQLRRLRRRPETGNARRRQPVGQPGLQRRLGTHDDQIGLDLACQGRQPVGVRDLHRPQLAQRLHARIARRDDQPPHQRRLCDLPRQGVLTPT